MTREEILQDLKNMLDELVEPCEDCISRQAALNCVTFNEVRHRMVDDIKALPSVTPKQKVSENLTSSNSSEKPNNCESEGTK